VFSVGAASTELARDVIQLIYERKLATRVDAAARLVRLLVTRKRS